MIKLIIALTFLSVSLEAVDFSEYRANKKIKKEFEEKKYTNAIESLETLIKKDPSNYKYYHNLGQAYLNTKKPEEAEKYFLQSLDLNKDQSTRNTELNLAASYLMQQKLSQAKKILKKLIMNNPNDLEAKHNYELAKILEEMQENQEQENQNSDSEDKEEQQQEQQEEKEEEQEEEQQQEEEQEQEQEQEQQAQDENEIEKELNEALKKEEEEKQKRIDQAKNILETLSQREEDARKKHAQKNASKEVVDYDW